MSLSTFLATVEKDVMAVVHTVEADAETALTWLWDAAKPIFLAAEPQVMQQALQALIDFLGKADAAIVGGTLEDIETAFLNELQVIGHEALADIQGLGSAVLQMLIGVAKAKL